MLVFTYALKPFQPVGNFIVNTCASFKLLPATRKLRTRHPKAVGSNPVPATTNSVLALNLLGLFAFWGIKKPPLGG
jgi:hypothetical protein